MMHHLITVCFPFVGDLVGGSHMSALGLIQHLDRTRYVPLVLVQSQTGAVATLFHEAGIATEEALPTPALVHGKRLTLRDCLRLAASARRLAQMLRARRVAIVHTNDGRTHATWALPARLAGARLVWHHRGSADALGLRLAAPLLASEVITVSRYAGQRGSHVGATRRSSVIHSPFNVGLGYDRTAVHAEICTELGLPETARLIAFSGVFIPRKRPLLFVEVIACLRRLRPELEIHGVMFGDPLEISAESIGSAAARLDAGDFVHVMGFRKAGERWLAGCEGLLVPAIDEPFGRTLVEAMLVGTPVVATDSGGNAEALRNGAIGILVPAEDVTAMAQGILSLLDRPDVARAYSRTARDDANARFGAAQHADQVMAIYDRVLRHSAMAHVA